ncbi:IclR family transcriptional regulator [Prauserella marina]|uniref:Glycerol operon regulatory protein n=1 Tax=Prauserella marina TaxID=530584 RepID=A0A222VLF8_9PSEU|nr:IclR family transcriptional regulator [Prauserella marina]ASR34759.1 IclR family transcriptional regulator [Prauserella marina]PWV85567.1 IclR family transcriptional regulator [Prauserella marina]SDC51692.1 DNA-binding transcriptional regulator, IclR family [Prauserella marina]
MESDRATGVRGVKSAARTVDLLELLASRQNRPARLRELSDALGAPRSSVYALIRTLVERGWVRVDITGTQYSIGIRALLAGTTYLDTDPYLRIVQPLITDLSAELDETIHYGRLDRGDIVYLATRESSKYIRPFSRVGRQLPAFSTSMGKSLLAERLDGGIDEHVPADVTPLTPNTIVDHDALLADLEKTRERGYAIDDEENYVGVRCFGFALRYTNPATDAISCSVPVTSLTEGRREEIVAAMERTRATIERMAPFDLAASAELPSGR